MKSGDVFEIETAQGKAYFQFVLRNEMYGSLIRVFYEIGERNKKELEAIINNKSGFLVFFPLGAAIKRKIVKRLFCLAIPENENRFPIFKTGVIDPRTGKVNQWWLWDGTNEWKYENIPIDINDYPIREVINDTLLIERILCKWNSRLT